MSAGRSIWRSTITNLDRLSAYAPQALAVLRFVTALLFIAHGTQKLFNFPPGQMGGVELMSLFGLAAILEAVGGLAILLGVFTRPVAFILAGEMAVAFWMAHAPQSPFPVNNGGDAAILFCFVFLHLIFAGPGSWSIDGRRAAT